MKQFCESRPHVPQKIMSFNNLLNALNEARGNLQPQEWDLILRTVTTHKESQSGSAGNANWLIVDGGYYDSASRHYLGHNKKTHCMDFAVMLDELQRRLSYEFGLRNRIWCQGVPDGIPSTFHTMLQQQPPTGPGFVTRLKTLKEKTGYDEALSKKVTIKVTKSFLFSRLY